MTEHSLLATIITKEGCRPGNHSPLGNVPGGTFCQDVIMCFFLVSFTDCEAAVLFSLGIITVCTSQDFPILSDDKSLTVTALRDLFILSLSLPYSFPTYIIMYHIAQ